MNLSYLGLGSNLHSPERQLRQAIELIKCLPNSYISKIASFYLSKAWGRKALPHYCNTVVALYTTLCPHQLLHYCQHIEKKQGRIRKLRWGSRTLDIDLLVYGSLKIDSPTLKIPHPRLHERDFVFVPLLEIATDPILINGTSLSELTTNKEHHLILKHCYLSN